MRIKTVHGTVVPYDEKAPQAPWFMFTHLTIDIPTKSVAIFDMTLYIYIQYVYVCVSIKHISNKSTLMAIYHF